MRYMQLVHVYVFSNPACVPVFPDVRKIVQHICIQLHRSCLYVRRTRADLYVYKDTCEGVDRHPERIG